MKDAQPALDVRVTLSVVLHHQALYDYVPNENDLQPLLAWLAVMERAHVNLAK